MNLHEYQAKQILQRNGIPVSRFAVVSSVQEAEKALDELGFEQAVLKVQIHAGGRGKAGGVKVASGRRKILGEIERLLGMKIVNEQTGPEGLVAHQVIIDAAEDAKAQYYVGAAIDRRSATAMLIVSPEGGVEIEEVAARHPERLLKVPISLTGTVRKFHLVHIAKFLGWKGELAERGMQIVSSVAKAFVTTDASLLEINPLALTADGRLTALDAKLVIDDNALFRQPEMLQCLDRTQMPEREARAREIGLEYIALDGNIGCMVNGAGLAMATMDSISQCGGRPANFLDVGGSATEEKIAEGFKLIVSDKSVKAILINIFGGIMNCETLADGLLAAAKGLDLKVPLVVRMEGTNADIGRRKLQESGLAVITAEGMADAAEKVVAASTKQL